MAVGRLQKIVRFDKNTPGAKGAGFADNYSTLLTTVGELKRRSSSRNQITGEINELNSYNLKVRWQQLLQDNLRSDLKVVIDGKVFTINGMPEKILERNMWYQFVITDIEGN